MYVFRKPFQLPGVSLIIFTSNFFKILFVGTSVRSFQKRHFFFDFCFIYFAFVLFIEVSCFLLLYFVFLCSYVIRQPFVHHITFISRNVPFLFFPFLFISFIFLSSPISVMRLYSSLFAVVILFVLFCYFIVFLSFVVLRTSIQERMVYPSSLKLTTIQSAQCFEHLCMLLRI